MNRRPSSAPDDTQLSLPLFDEPGTAAPTPPSAVRRVGGWLVDRLRGADAAPAVTPRVKAPAAAPAPVPVADLSPAPRAPVRDLLPLPLPPAVTAPVAVSPTPLPLLRHARANREVRLGEHRVGYELRRGRRRTIGFLVGDEGLSVTAPRWVGQGEIDGALQEKSRWILRKLAEQSDRRQRHEAARVDWKDGTTLPYLGEPVIVVLDPRVSGAQLNTAAQALPGVPRLTLHVGLPQSAEPAQIRDVVQAWLQRQARALFDERCRHFAQRLGVRYTRLSLSSAQTRWGSATSTGAIRLNWRLVHFAMPTIDYVVAHELAHLREMNHSAAFWDVVRSVMPDYEQRRGELKDGQVPVFD
jgi:predicted metal-dependent hydrolase